MHSFREVKGQPHNSIPGAGREGRKPWDRLRGKTETFYFSLSEANLHFTSTQQERIKVVHVTVFVCVLHLLSPSFQPTCDPIKTPFVSIMSPLCPSLCVPLFLLAVFPSSLCVCYSTVWPSTFGQINCHTSGAKAPRLSCGSVLSHTSKAQTQNYAMVLQAEVWSYWCTYFTRSHFKMKPEISTVWR